MMIKRKFSLATLMTFVALSAVAFFGVDYFSPSSQYQREHDVETLRHLLSTRISDGDELGYVTSLLGTGETDVSNRYLDMMLRWQSGKGFIPVAFPNEIRKGDVFVHYEAKPKGHYALQFRAGKLINHDPNWYIGPDETMAGLTN